MCFSGLAARTAAPDPRKVFDESTRRELSRLVDSTFGSTGRWVDCLNSLDHLDPLHHVALYLYGVGAWRTLRASENRPRALAGYSLGVYVALTAAGSLRPEDGVPLVLEAGYGIRSAQPALEHGIVAVNGLRVERVPELLEGMEEDGVAALTHVNSPTNFILTCPRDAVAGRCERALELGAYTASAASFPGASHCHLMKPHLVTYQELLETLEIEAPEIDLFSCVTAGPVTTREDARNLLRNQLTHPVRFFDTIEAMSGDGLGRFVVVGTCQGIPALLAFLKPDAEVILWPGDAPGGHR